MKTLILAMLLVASQAYALDDDELLNGYRRDKPKSVQMREQMEQDNREYQYQIERREEIENLKNSIDMQNQQLNDIQYRLNYPYN